MIIVPEAGVKFNDKSVDALSAGIALGSLTHSEHCRISIDSVGTLELLTVHSIAVGPFDGVGKRR